MTYLAELVGDPPMDVRSVACPRTSQERTAAKWPHWRGQEDRATIAWADETLAAIGRTRVCRAVQVKSWNLSSILRLPTAAGDVGARVFRHSSLMKARSWRLSPPGSLRSSHRCLAGPTTGTVLLDDVPGEDDRTLPNRGSDDGANARATPGTVADRNRELLSSGLPDWRSPTLPDRVDTLLSRSDVRAQLSGEERSALDAVASGLRRRLAELGDCGLPETLVHGDFHQGNWRFDGSSLVLLDWGDSGVGHAMLDLSAFAERIPDEARPAFGDRGWDASSRTPGCRPPRAPPT